MDAVFDAVANNAIAIVLAVLPFVLPNDVIYGFGFAIGKVCTRFLRQRIGPSGEAIESYFQGTLAAFTVGINDGLDSDDKKEAKASE